MSQPHDPREVSKFLWASVSSSVRYEGQTAHGLVLWLKGGHNAWLVGVQWRSAVITIMAGHGGGLQDSPVLPRDSVGNLPI